MTDASSPDPWAAYVEPATSAPAQSADPWAVYVEPSAPTPVYSGSILPMTRYSDGSVGFDSDAGILGQFKRALTLPGDVATGAVDPTSPDAIARSFNLAGAATPLTPGIAAGDYAIPGVLSTLAPGKTAAPTADALHAAASAGYDAARDMGVEYSSPHVADMAQGVQAGLNGDGILGVLAPKTHAILDDLQAVPAGASTVPFGNLDAARKALGFAARDFTNPTEQLAAKRAQEAIDGFVTNPDPMAVVSGPAAEAGAAITTARANAAAGFRSDRINGVERAADLRSAAANSGANIGNSTRQRVASVLLDPKQAAGFSPDEIAALEGVVHGSRGANAARWAANMAGGGGGIAHSGVSALGAGLGAALGGEAGAMIGGAGAATVGPALKAVQNRFDTGALAKVDQLVRQRSPLYDALTAATPPVVQQQARTAALAKALAGGSPGGPPPPSAEDRALLAAALMGQQRWTPEPGSI
jgi:hypothetical protein